MTAADDWDAPAQRMQVRPPLTGSLEAILHATGLGNCFLDLARTPALAAAFDDPRLERAIGVIYRPRTERMSHYFHARLSRQFDAVLHYDVTRAVEPLERSGLWERGEVADLL